MIELSPYSVFEHVDIADAIINTINTKGYMGKGLALEFALRFPEMNEEYKKLCQKNEIKPGGIFKSEQNISYYSSLAPEKRSKKKILIYNMATKDDYKLPSKYEWIEKGLKELLKFINEDKVRTIVIPKLGAGLGKLKWDKVEELIVRYLHALNLKIVIALDLYSGPVENYAIKKVENKLFLKDTLFEKKIGVKIERFRDLMKLEGIGKKKYSKLLNECF
ncbi:macro domain-containing protein [Thermosipho ferrireducens]|uniref:Macro domain-containing protein n=1 Tax=Thermosipho ferrireducens TaxID=2571116 RepID=A0ABX7S880_9BACT|nr:macro domain-containing protein [Thermosipho ferrireducens]QTA38803.1 macro domain-containing protein [Thermosipho ferrireducens]